MSGQAQIGFLTLLEHLRYCEVGQHVMTHCVIYLVQIESELIDFCSNCSWIVRELSEELKSCCLLE